MVAGVITASVFIAFDTTPSFAGDFDGRWKVSRTGKGCKPKGVIKVRISEDKFSGSYVGGTGKHIISGTIKDSGSFKFIAKSPKDNVHFKGKISGSKGSGSWNVAGRNCGGSLKIYK